MTVLLVVLRRTGPGTRKAPLNGAVFLLGYLVANAVIYPEVPTRCGRGRRHARMGFVAARCVSSVHEAALAMTRRLASVA